jgi:hypothetical protein
VVIDGETNERYEYGNDEECRSGVNFYYVVEDKNMIGSRIYEDDNVRRYNRQ